MISTVVKSRFLLAAALLFLCAAPALAQVAPPSFCEQLSEWGVAENQVILFEEEDFGGRCSQYTLGPQRHLEVPERAERLSPTVLGQIHFIPRSALIGERVAVIFFMDFRFEGISSIARASQADLDIVSDGRSLIVFWGSEDHPWGLTTFREWTEFPPGVVNTQQAYGPFRKFYPVDPDHNVQARPYENVFPQPYTATTDRVLVHGPVHAEIWDGFEFEGDSYTLGSPRRGSTSESWEADANLWGWDINSMEVRVQDADTPPPPMGALSLRLRKDLVQDCEYTGLGYECEFRITVRNIAGSVTYEQPTEFQDQLLERGLLLSFEPSGQWNCTPTGAFGALVRCRAEPLYLRPYQLSGHESSFVLRVYYPQSAFEDGLVRNCANLAPVELYGDLGQGCAVIVEDVIVEDDGQKSDDQADKGPDDGDGEDFTIEGYMIGPVCPPHQRADVEAGECVDRCSHDESWEPVLGICADGRPERPELSIDVNGPAACAQGQSCDYEISIKNAGPGTYSGPLFIEDHPPGGPEAKFISATSGWSCALIGPNIACNRDDVVLAPGDALTFQLTIRQPDAFRSGQVTAGHVENCAWIVRPFGTVPLGMSEQTGRWYALEVALALKGYLDPSRADGDVEDETFDAIRAYEADNGIEGSGIFPSGALLRHIFTGSAGLVGDQVGDNDKHCVLINVGVVHFVIDDLSVTKSGPDICRAGASCAFDITVTNSGGGRFTGTIWLNDVMAAVGSGSYALPMVLASPPELPWQCEIGALLSCSRPDTRLEPGESVTLSLAVMIPPDYDRDEIKNAVDLDRERIGERWDDVTSNNAAAVNVRIGTYRSGEPEESEPHPDTCPQGTWFDEEVNDCVIRDGPQAEAEDDEAKQDVEPGDCLPDEVRDAYSGECVKEREDYVQPTCHFGTVEDGRCTCTGGRIAKEIPDSASAYLCGCPEGQRWERGQRLCVARAPEITCGFGTVEDGRCTCTGGRIAKEIPDLASAYFCGCPEGQRWDDGQRLCVARAPEITCGFGRVEDGRCTCTGGRVAKSIPNRENAFFCGCPEGQRWDRTERLCVAEAAEITCQFGTVTDGRCTCTGGRIAKRVPNLENAFFCGCPEGQRWDGGQRRCVARTADITCQWGTVEDGQCMCTGGRIARQVPNRANAYFCGCPDGQRWNQSRQECIK